MTPHGLPSPDTQNGAEYHPQEEMHQVGIAKPVLLGCYFPWEHMYLKLLFVPIWNGFQVQHLQQMVLCGISVGTDGKRRQPEQDLCSLNR